MESTSDILGRHLRSFAEFGLHSLPADYAADAVLFASAGVLKGPHPTRFVARNGQIAGHSFAARIKPKNGGPLR